MPRHEGNTPARNRKKNRGHRMHRKTRAARLATRIKQAVASR